MICPIENASTKNYSHRFSENGTLSRVSAVLRPVRTRFRPFQVNDRRKSKFNGGLESASHTIINTSIFATATAHSELNWTAQAKCTIKSRVA
jgi:hypothetical protein